MDRMNDWLVTGERPLPHFVTPFAKSASGGSSKDDDDPEDDDPEDDPEDDDLADMSDEELREALRESNDKLKRQSDRNARRRKRDKREREEAARKPAPAPRRKPAAKDDDEDIETVRENARREGESAGTLRAKKAEAKAELIAAGVPRERAARAVGMLDLDEIDLDDDGLDGIEEAIDKLRKDVPEFFAKKRTRRGSVAGEGDRGGEKGGRRKEMTPSERQAAIATGRGRR